MCGTDPFTTLLPPQTLNQISIRQMEILTSSSTALPATSQVAAKVESEARFQVLTRWMAVKGIDSALLYPQVRLHSRRIGCRILSSSAPS